MSKKENMQNKRTATSEFIKIPKKYSLGEWNLGCYDCFFDDDSLKIRELDSENNYHNSSHRGRTI